VNSYAIPIIIGTDSAKANDGYGSTAMLNEILRGKADALKYIRASIFYEQVFDKENTLRMTV